MDKFFLNYKVVVFTATIFLYLPYCFQNLLTGDTAYYHSFYSDNVEVLGQIKRYLITQAKPLYGLTNVLVPVFGLSPEFITFVSVLIFTYSLLKMVELVFGDLNNFSKATLTILAFSNPYVYGIRDWFDQFLGQAIINLLYYYAIKLLLKYQGKEFSLQKFLSYSFTVITILIGLNFFMPTFFWFAGLGLILTIKQHYAYHFKNIKDFLLYARSFLLVLFLAGLFYVIEIKSLFSLFDIDLHSFKNSQPWRDLNMSFVGRVLHLPVIYPMFYNILGLSVATLLFFKKDLVSRLILAIIFIYYLSSYFFYLVLNMSSSTALNFPNYYTTIFMLGFLLLAFKNSRKVNKVYRVASISFIVFFNVCSYHLYYQGYIYEENVKETFANVREDVYDISGFKDVKIRIISNKNNFVFKFVRNIVVTRLYTTTGSLYGAKGSQLGFKDIMFVPSWIEQDAYVKQKREQLLKANKIYPDPKSIFVYKGVYYVVA